MSTTLGGTQYHRVPPQNRLHHNIHVLNKLDSSVIHPVSHVHTNTQTCTHTQTHACIHAHTHLVYVLNCTYLYLYYHSQNWLYAYTFGPHSGGEAAGGKI